VGRILIVDDNEPAVRALTEFLGAGGYEVVSALTLEEGKRLADEQKPDLLIVDIRLGPYNGLQLALREHLRNPQLPIITTTGYPDPVLEREARSYGAEFMEKPIRPLELMALVRRLLPIQTRTRGIENSELRI
jgi:DNA-binding response OmpR family regulator